MAGVTYDVKLDIQNALSGIQRIEQALGGLNTKMSTVSRATSTLATGLKALAGVAAGAGLANYTSEIQDMENKLRVASNSQEEFNRNFQLVRAIADNTGQSLNAVGSLYAKVAVQAEKLGYNQAQVATATNAFSLALKASGASSQGAASAIYQYTQILMKGKVNGDEFTTIMENLGGPVMDLVAQKLGVTTEQLFKMKEEGRLTAQMFTSALIKSMGDLQGMADKMAPTVGQAMNRMRNSFGQFLHDLQATTGIFTKLANLVDFIAQNFKVLAMAITIAAGAWAGAKIAAWGIMAFEAVKGIVALTASIRALGVTAAIAEAIATGGLSSILTLTGGLAGAAAAAYGANKLFDGFATSVGESNVDLNQLAADAQNNLPTGLNASALSAEKLAKVLKQMREEMDRSNLNYVRQAYNLENNLRLATESLNLSERERTLKQSLLQIETTGLNEINDLREKIARYRLGSAEEKAQVEQLEIYLVSLTYAYKTHREEMVKLNGAYQDAYNAKQLQIFGTQEQIRVENELMRIQSDIAKMTMTEIEQKYYDIEQAANASAKAAIEAEQARRNEKLSPQEIEAYYAKAREGVDTLKAKTKESYNQSREWSTGWKRAMNEYVANATNAARQAENIFRTATQGMEEAIVNFAKTGKFEWRNFVSMMLEELLRSQVQQLFANMMGGMRNTMSSFASGYMPGESGGIPTGGSSGGLLGGIIGGIGKLFGGFFANGGVLGAGRWGIAGEAGPEIIRGPATITPLNAGQTTVVYNINAVDAMSFKQLVARDPGFIYAVSQQGAKSIPNRR